ncbi:MAG: isoaspartyl peptidase/L-asparaginase [Bacteroidota bacterium]
MNLQIAASESSGPVLLLHGGAWAIPDDEVDAHVGGVRAAAEVGRHLIESGKTALDIAVAVVEQLEAHPAFDAGTGSVLTREGLAELDAGVMDGPSLAFGAVAGVRRLAHPIRAAERLLHHDGQARLLVGEGAEAFAAEHGIPLVDNASLIVPRELGRHRRLAAEAGFHTSSAFDGHSDGPAGTVGCVVRDVNGQLAAATSTGGAPFTRTGRVGDSPLPGCGYYADEHAAASTTGWGEAIAAVLLAGRAVDAIAAGNAPEYAARQGLTRLHERIQSPNGQGATAGLILADAWGRYAWAHTTPRMARAGWTRETGIWTGI